MNIQTVYPVVVTDALGECKDFYTRWFGFRVVFEASWFCLLGTADGAVAIAFMAPDHPSRPPGPEPFSGDGVLLTMQVEDSSSEFDRLSLGGLDIEHPLTREPWGQRRFGLRDPAGVWVDIVEQTEPETGFWEQYPAGLGAG